MWRSFSSKLAVRNLSAHLILRNSPKSYHHGILVRYFSTTPESTDPGIGSIQSFGSQLTSANAFDLSSLAAASILKAKEMADLTKHYGRCYWELSKARLSMLVVATSGTGYILGSMVRRNGRGMGTRLTLTKFQSVNVDALERRYVDKKRRAIGGTERNGTAETAHERNGKKKKK